MSPERIATGNTRAVEALLKSQSAMIPLHHKRRNSSSMHDSTHKTNSIWF